MQQTRQFLDEARKLLGEKFIVISCEDSIKYKTSEKDGIKIMVSLQDDNSVVFLDLIQVKIRNTAPSIPSNEMANIKGKQVKFKNGNIQLTIHFFGRRCLYYKKRRRY